MIDINLIRTNPELVKENIKKKFQDEKLPLVDEVVNLDKENRSLKQEGDELRASRNKLSAEVGKFMKEKNFEEAEKIKAQVKKNAERIVEIEEKQAEIEAEIKKRMMVIPNILDASVPVGKDDSENVEVERFGEAIVPNYEIPYNADILESICGLDKDAAGRTSGNGFYYLLAYNDSSKKMITYRVDRMTDVNCTGEPREGIKAFEEIDMNTYKQKVFSMFSGKETSVTIRFITPLLDTMIDRFGKDRATTIYSKIDERHCTITTSVEISDQFFGWLLGFGKKVKLLSPDDVVEKFKAYIDKIRVIYD